jgi:iron complex transport system ATP-binding protein
LIPIAGSGLCVSYNGTRAVANLDFAVREGSWVSLIGPNGAGKTTVLRAVAGLQPFEGELRIGSADVKGVSRRSLARLVAYVPQRPVLPSGMTVTDYVLMGRNPYIDYFSTERSTDLDAVEEALIRLELIDFTGRDVGSLSGGESQRAILARALAQRAPVLLLDEPTSELDIGHQQQALELVEQLRLQVGLTVLSTMHDLTVAGQYSQEFVLLDRGRAVARGSAEEVLRADLIERFYRASVDVLFTEAGLVVVPTRPPPKGGTG